MNKTGIELPDGRLLTIHGGNATEVASVLRNHYLDRTALVRTSDAPEGEPCLELPRWHAPTNSEPTTSQNNYAGMGVTDNEVECLDMPVMNFARPQPSGSAARTVAVVDNEECLELPSTI